MYDIYYYVFNKLKFLIVLVHRLQQLWLLQSTLFQYCSVLNTVCYHRGRHFGHHSYQPYNVSNSLMSIPHLYVVYDIRDDDYVETMIREQVFNFGKYIVRLLYLDHLFSCTISYHTINGLYFVWYMHMCSSAEMKELLCCYQWATLEGQENMAGMSIPGMLHLYYRHLSGVISMRRHNFIDNRKGKLKIYKLAENRGFQMSGCIALISTIYRDNYTTLSFALTRQHMPQLHSQAWELSGD